MLCRLPMSCSLLYLCSCLFSRNCPDRVVKTKSVICVSLRFISLCGPFSLSVQGQFEAVGSKAGIHPAAHRCLSVCADSWLVARSCVRVSHRVTSVRVAEEHVRATVLGKALLPALRTLGPFSWR